MIEKSGTLGTTIFMQDEAGHLVGEYSSTGALVEETIWLGDIPVATLRPNGSSVNIFYVHTDHLNTPRKVSRPSDNKLEWRWDADPFGTAAVNQNPQGLGTFLYNIRFPGQYYQAETGLNQNVNRDYDPLTGKYLESDLLGLRGGLNTYAYATDPITQVDPMGLMGVASGAVVSHVGPWPNELSDFTPCKYYKQMCDKTGCRYYCFTGPAVCNNAQAAPFWFSFYGATKLNCVRRCLVQKDKEAHGKSCNGPGCLPDSVIDGYHRVCFEQCGIPASVYPGVNPWWLPFNPNAQ
jgi:RHS repeat-associated protein